MPLVKYLKSRPFPGSKGASMHEVILTFTRSIKHIRLTERAAAISFNFIMAIPPTFIFLFSLIAYLPLATVETTLLNTIALLSPNPKLYNSVAGVLVDLMKNKRSELISIGFLSTLFLSSNGVMGILRSFDRESPILRKRSGIARRKKALTMTMGLMVVLLVAIALLILQSNILDNYVTKLIGSAVLVKIISWVSLIGIVYTTICILYKYGPSLHYKTRFFSAGARLATVLFVIVSHSFFYIANHFINYNKVYGSIGTLLMFMIWVYITSLVILIGYEINVAIILKNQKEAIPKNTI
jgi:membrane protein